VRAGDLRRTVADGFLQLKDVREVGADRQAELDLRRVVGPALQLDTFMQAVADEALPPYADGVRPDLRQLRVGEEEGGGEGLHRAGAENQQFLAVEP
jgi:hypothetical protein